MVNKENQKENQLDQEYLDALAKYLDAIVSDYAKLYEGKEDAYEKVEEFRESLSIRDNTKYSKVIRENSVHSFIVKEDGPKFKKGDILKPAGFAGPAKNKARGNIFGEYTILWTGPVYLRG